MNVLMINASARENGNTALLLSEIAKELNAENIETRMLVIGNKVRRGCIGCAGCKKAKSGLCAFDDDIANETIRLAAQADGFIFASPVYFAGAAGAICSLLERAFYAGGKAFEFKPASAVAVCRRGGASAALDRLNKFITYNSMPLISSQYWNIAHGAAEGEAAYDAEGLQIMRTLGKNMAWILKSIEAGEKAGICRPELEARTFTNFIR